MPYYDWILWLDTDAFIVNMTLPLTHWTDLASTASLIVSDYGLRVNNGAFLIKGHGDAKALEYMELWWELSAKPFVDGPAKMTDNGPFK